MSDCLDAINILWQIRLKETDNMHFMDTESLLKGTKLVELEKVMPHHMDINNLSNILLKTMNSFDPFDLRPTVNLCAYFRVREAKKKSLCDYHVFSPVHQYVSNEA